MTRPGRRRSLTITAAVVALLAAPAAARAATYTVAPGGGSCGGGDTTCETLAEAAAAVSPGDDVNVAPGVYASATFDDGGITITGSKTPPGTAVNGVLTFTASSGDPVILRQVAVGQSSGSGPAIDVTGSAGLNLRDSLIGSAHGHGVTISAGTANKIERTTVFTGGAATNAVRVTSADTSSAPKQLTIESSIVTGGAAGLAVVTGNDAADSSAGDVTVAARHITAAGSTNGIVLDASHARSLGSGAGNITATVSDSIVLNGSPTTSFPGVLGVGANRATISFERTIQGGDPNALFVNPAGRNFKLRAGSPAIDQGGFTPGESPTDIEGDPRPGPVTDLGADEFLNRAPTARIAASAPTVRSGRPITFSAAGSSDPEGAIARYEWSFGDGTTASTAIPQVDHTYAREGVFEATVVVVDSLGASSAPASVAVAVGDGSAPFVSIDRPRKNQAIRLVTVRRRTVTRDGESRRVTTRRRTRIRFAGKALDASGVASVTLALRQVRRTTVRPRAGSAQTSTRCRWFDPRRGIVSRSCNRPVFFRARLAANGVNWAYTVPRARRLAAGTYRLFAGGTDKQGVSGNSFRPDNVSFRLR